MILLDFSIYGPTLKEIGEHANLFTFDLGIFKSFALTFFCFICHLFVFPIRKELHNPTAER